MRSLSLLLSLLVITVAACGKVKSHADGGLEDASTFDADVTDDDDAAPADAAPDAPTDVDGRPPEIDGGGTTQGEVCGEVCQAAVGCFGGKVDLEECLAECPGEIGDCTQLELETLAACTEQDCKSVFTCLEEVPCLGGGADCGNESCDEGESCETCESDCGPCVTVCGDGICGVGECAECGSDCPDGCVCPHDTCTVGVALDPGCGTCEAQVCAADSYCCNNSWDSTCVNESETICDLACPAVCGDGSCDEGETLESCPGDCQPVEEFCGNGICAEGETCQTCTSDCGACPLVCGDGICAVGECASCGSDCPGGCNCPHDTCTLGVALDPGCGSCEAAICANDPYCCNNNFDGLCLGQSESVCGLDCPAVCGDTYCDPLENPTTCPTDCQPLE
jgi:hypothetical protein